MLSTAQDTPRTQGILSYMAPNGWLWVLTLDFYPALAAFMLPWSTSAVSVLIVLWLGAIIPTIQPRPFWTSVKRPESLLPLVFFALALVGMLWADAPWAVRLQGLYPVSKLLVIPLLLYHFSRSRRASWVFVAFLASCALLMGFSWVIYFVPGLKFTATETAGVPVNNYIDQSQEFALCLFATAPLLLMLLERKRWIAALGCGVLLLGFFCDMMFVVIARTAFVYMPVLLALFAARYFRPKEAAGFLAAALTIVVLVGLASPYVRHRVQWIVHDANLRAHTDLATSDGERMAYWRTSVRSIEAAPVFGHGTGSTKPLFEREAAGKTGEWANLIRNPHNQTLYVAIQWGLLGCIVLYAMWYFHLALFLGRSLVAWIGLVVIVQNFASSLVNSHLFDFHEGWIYVLGVGVAGGMIAARRNEPNDALAKAPSSSGI
ncbi:MAG: O-antigen ligase family protein [Bradyrhizobium sp.]|uniref:O-antigen ligase family protein n=1 Tax=Bradyrhizobium sp. TaxID=376 RepID=UPI00239632D0|nr:O-antigen ligase family protein [Bradyrhizobium sp.]MDE2604130.1 O-antigen ligase family protein [Bradyrhizobium sp.]